VIRVSAVVIIPMVVSVFVSVIVALHTSAIGDQEEADLADVGIIDHEGRRGDADAGDRARGRGRRR